MNNISDQNSTYGYRDQASGAGSAGASQAGRSGQSISQPASGGASTASSGAQSAATSGSSQTSGQDFVQTAKSIGSKVSASPYTLPIAIGGVAFILGALASSKILRQIVLIAGGYAVKYAIQNAPKDEILDYAKNFVKSSLAQPRTA